MYTYLYIDVLNGPVLAQINSCCSSFYRLSSLMKSDTKYPVHMYPPFPPRPAGPIDGVFLVDSIAFCRSEYGRTNYMADALQYILWSTGLYCVAIVDPAAGYDTFRIMVSSIPASSGHNFFVVILSCSRDAYGLAQKRLLGSDIRGGVGGLYLQEMIEKDASRIAAYVSG